MTENIPSTYKLPLEGEWTVYASGEVNDLNGSANVFIAAIEHVDGSGVSTETTNIKEVGSEGCREGMSKGVSVDKAAAECCQQLGMADSDPSQDIEPVDVPNETDMLLVLLIKLEDLCSSGILHVRLGGMQMRLQCKWTWEPSRWVEGPAR